METKSIPMRMVQQDSTIVLQIDVSNMTMAEFEELVGRIRTAIGSDLRTRVKMWLMK